MALQQYLVGKEKNSFLASRAFKKKLFGEHHPYGMSLDDVAINQVNREHVCEFYHKIPKQSGALLFISGLMEQQHIDAIKGCFRQLDFSEGAGELVDVKPVEVTKAQRIYQERPEMVQSTIKIGRTVFTKDHPDQIAFQVLNTVLGGYFGSRLMQNIREEKGLSYGIHSSLSFMQHAGIWGISSEVKKDQKDIALAEIYKELQRLKDEPVDDDELNRVKNYMAGSFVKAINSPTAQINCHKSIAIYKLSEDYYNQYIEKVRAVDAKELQRVANEYFTDDLLEVVVG